MIAEMSSQMTSFVTPRNNYRQILIVVSAVESEILTDMRGDLLVNRQLFNQEHKIPTNIVVRSVKHLKRTLIGENDMLRSVKCDDAL